MSFRKPFRSAPVRKGAVYQRREKRRNARATLRLVMGCTLVSSLVFGTGMFLTNGGSLALSRFVNGEGDTCAFLSVHDGDTIRCNAEKVRLANIDAPELYGSPRCGSLRFGSNPSWCDDDLAEQSRDALSAFLDSGAVEIHRVGEDRYGRTLATVTVNGDDAGAYLVGLGLAREWQD